MRTVPPQFRGLDKAGFLFCTRCGLLAPLLDHPLVDQLALAAFFLEQPGIVNAICQCPSEPEATAS